MRIIITILLTIVLYIPIMYITVRYLLLEEEPPKVVRKAGMAEAIFGMLIWCPLWFYFNRYFTIFVLSLSFFWICVAISLYRGSKTGRTICLVLSILRIPTIIGIPFSLFSLHKLYFTQESKDYFDNKPSLQDNSKLTVEE